MDGNKIWMDIYSEPNDSKWCVPFYFNHPKNCLKNMPFCLARRIFTSKNSRNEKYITCLNNFNKSVKFTSYFQGYAITSQSVKTPPHLFYSKKGKITSMPWYLATYIKFLKLLLIEIYEF